MGENWKSQNVEVNGHRVHFTRTGNGGKPPLVLVHGFTDKGMTWAPVARDFENEFDVVMPDMIGHGLSSRLVPGQQPDMPGDLAALVHQLGLRDPVIAGHSMGAMVSFQACLRFPGLARALVLEDPPWFPLAQAPDPATADRSIVAWAKSLQGTSASEFAAQYRRDNPEWTEEFIRIMFESKMELDAGIIEPMFVQMNSREWYWRSGVPALKIPTLLLAGNPSLGGIVTPEVVSAVRELKPDIEVTSFPRLGHLIRFKAHDEFVARVRKFLGDLAPKPAQVAAESRGQS